MSITIKKLVNHKVVERVAEEATVFIKTKDGRNHRFDAAGNHFINGRCVNPKVTPFLENRGFIGSTYPNVDDVEKSLAVWN